MTRNEIALTIQLVGIAIPLITIGFMASVIVGVLITGAYLLWVGHRLERDDD